MPRATSGRRDGAWESGASDQLRKLERAFQGSIHYGTVVRAYPRTVDREILPDMLASRPDPRQWRQDTPRAYPDGSASFGGAYAVVGHVDAGVRTSALDPQTAEVQRMVGKLNSFVNANALLGLLKPGLHQGSLRPEGDSVACVLEDYIRDILESRGVLLDRAFCDRPTWRRIMGSAAESHGPREDAPPLDACVTAQLPGIPDVKLTALPGRFGLLHLKPTSGMQHTDGEVMMGHRSTTTGCDIALVAYKEFVSTSTAKRSSVSGATWKILPPEDDAAEPADQGGLPPRRSAARGALDAVPRVCSAALEIVSLIQNAHPSAHASPAG